IAGQPQFPLRTGDCRGASAAVAPAGPALAAVADRPRRRPGGGAGGQGAGTVAAPARRRRRTELPLGGSGGRIYRAGAAGRVRTPAGDAGYQRGGAARLPPGPAAGRVRLERSSRQLAGFAGSAFAEVAGTAAPLRAAWRSDGVLEQGRPDPFRALPRDWLLLRP